MFRPLPLGRRLKGIVSYQAKRGISARFGSNEIPLNCIDNLDISHSHDRIAPDMFKTALFSRSRRTQPASQGEGRELLIWMAA